MSYLVELKESLAERYEKPIDNPDELKILPEYWRVNTPVYQHYVSGWHANNSVRVQDCIPHFTNPCAAHPTGSLGTLEDALVDSMHNLDTRIREATKIRNSLESTLNKIRSNQRGS